MLASVSSGHRGSPLSQCPGMGLWVLLLFLSDYFSLLLSFSQRAVSRGAVSSPPPPSPLGASGPAAHGLSRHDKFYFCEAHCPDREVVPPCSPLPRPPTVEVVPPTHAPRPRWPHLPPTVRSSCPRPRGRLCPSTARSPSPRPRWPPTVRSLSPTLSAHSLLQVAIESMYFCAMWCRVGCNRIRCCCC